MKRIIETFAFIYVASALLLAYAKPTYQLTEHGRYTVIIWSRDYCPACVKYKKQEKPKLEKHGYKVEVREAPESETVPTITLYYNNVILHSEVYWTADDIEKFVENRSKVK